MSSAASSSNTPSRCRSCLPAPPVASTPSKAEATKSSTAAVAKAKNFMLSKVLFRREQKKCVLTPYATLNSVALVAAIFLSQIPELFQVGRIFDARLSRARRFVCRRVDSHKYTKNRHFLRRHADNVETILVRSARLHEWLLLLKKAL